jgi:TetR/AcrR family transcriptional regulator, cholesterol catabolism regulator
LAVQESANRSVAELSGAQRRRRQAIVDVATELVSVHGSAVEIRDIAEKAGVAIGTVYRYFENKDALCCEVYLNWRFAHLQEIADSAAAARTNGARMRAALRKSVELFEKTPNFTELGSSMSLSREPSIFERRDAIEQKNEELFRSLLVGVRPKDAEAIVSTILSVFYFQMLRWRAGNASIERAYRALDDAVRLTLDGGRKRG